MKNNIFLTLIILITFSMNGQSNNEKKSSKKDTITIKPQKNNYTVAINLGRGIFLTSGLNNSFGTNNVSGQATTNVIDRNYNDATNMIGAEGRYFIKSNWAVTLSGGFHFSNTPVALAIPAIESGAITIPGYDAVVEDKRLDANITLGGLYFFNNKNKRLAPFVGLLVPVSFATRTSYDPTIVNTTTGQIRDLGAKNIAATSFGIQAVAGIDYYLTDNLYFGISIKPLSYITSTSKKIPGPGLLERKVINYSFNAFVQPQFSIGFKL